jgi:hypothetical protein
MNSPANTQPKNIIQKTFKTITYITYPGFWAALGTYLLYSGFIEYNSALNIIGDSGTQADTLNSSFIESLPESTKLWIITWASFALHALLPLVFVVVMVKRKVFPSLHLPDLKHRLMAVGVSLVLAISFSGILRLLEAPSVLYAWNQLVIFSLLIQLLFNSMKFKISIHMLSASAFFAFFFLYASSFNSLMSSELLSTQSAEILKLFYLTPNQWLIAAAINLPVVYLARYVLKAHDHAELIIGFIVGISITFMNEWIFRSLGM